MFCSKCGKAIPNDSVFCPECGEPLGKQQAAVAVSGEEVSKGMNIGIIAASVFIPLVGVIMGAIYMKDKNPGKQKAGKRWLWVGIGMAIFWVLYAVGQQ